MINTERNRALLTDLFAALGRKGWGEVFLAALRDDVVFNCSVPHSHSDASATKSDSPNDVNAYSTPGGTSLKSRRVTMPSTSISLRCWITIFSLIPCTTRHNSPKRRASDCNAHTASRADPTAHGRE